MSQARTPVRPGDRYGRWTVAGVLPEAGPTRVRAQCDCGTESDVRLSWLRYEVRRGREPGCRDCRPGRRARQWTPERVRELVRLRRRGLTYEQIAGQYGVTRQMVWSLIARACEERLNDESPASTRETG